MNAEETIIYLIQLYTQYLDELSLSPRNDFTIGEMTAAVTAFYKLFAAYILHFFI